jgi:hypothetical protein
MAFAVSAVPAFAATSLNVPIVASAPSLDPHASSAFTTAGVAKLDYTSTGASATEPASVRVASDNSSLYVRFDVPQREQIIGFAGGDSVAVDLWPNGASGEQYHIGVGIDGNRTSDSTANTAGWQTAAASYSGGYTVTLKIPMSAVGTTNSRVQFSRWISSIGEDQVWSHNSGQTTDDQVAQAGTLTFAAAVGKN